MSSTLTKKGQVTVPKEVRLVLGVSGSDRIRWIIDRGAVRVEPAHKSFAALAGTVPALPGRESIDFEDIIDEAMQEEADKLIKSLEQV